VESKAIHYDGSVQMNDKNNTNSVDEPFEITEEMRKNSSGNPFIIA
jgi:hypothetical protein